MPRPALVALLSADDTAALVEAVKGLPVEKRRDLRDPKGPAASCVELDAFLWLTLEALLKRPRAHGHVMVAA